MQTALKVRNLKKSFPVTPWKSKTVFNGVHFSIPNGKTTGFIGSNGSGKTTSIKCILGFIFPDAGEITFFNDQKMSAELRKKIGFLPERPYIPDFITVRELLHFHWRLAGGGPDFEVRCNEIIRRVDLQHALDRPLRAFSKGMQQRAAIAQTILLKPELIILDEPMTGLDPDGRLIVKEIIREEQKRGASIFFSSHLLNDMDELCSHIVMLEKGELKFSGSMEQFFGEEADDFEITFRPRQGPIIHEKVSSKELHQQLQKLMSEKHEILRVEKKHQSVEQAYARMKSRQKENTK